MALPSSWQGLCNFEAVQSLESLFHVPHLREDVMSVSARITPHLIKKLIQIFPVVTLNDIFVTLNVTLNQNQIMSVVCVSKATGSGSGWRLFLS